MRMELDVTTGNTLLEVSTRVDDPAEGLRRVAEEIRSREARIFATADGGTWDPLNPSTVARKHSARILVEHGVLQRSLTAESARYAETRITPDSLFVGTKDPVARLHRAGARGMPQRDVVPAPSAREAERWAGILGGYLVDGP